jgi:endonuclease YncB( thermonuclease family)
LNPHEYARIASYGTSLNPGIASVLKIHPAGTEAKLMRILRFLLRLFPARPKFPSPPRPVPRLPVPAPGQVSILRGRCWVIDGDTIVIDKVRIRLAGIDAPELDHPFGVQSKWALVKLCKGQTITARLRPELSYDRIVAELSTGRPRSRR